MKNLAFKSVLVALCTIAIVGCKKKDEPNSSVMPCPPYLSVHGTITNEEGVSLNSIQVTLQKEDAWWWSNFIEYTNESGVYEYCKATSSSGFLYGIIDEFPADFPKNICVFENYAVLLPGKIFTFFAHDCSFLVVIASNR